jgi:hypothetical protein
MEPFEFHPELFELRNAVLETLAENGFVWLSDFSAIDLCHDTYGLEVCGIRNEEDARSIAALLARLFPTWHYARRYYKGHPTLEPGWKVILSRDPENHRDRWQQVG